MHKQIVCKPTECYCCGLITQPGFVMFRHIINKYWKYWFCRDCASMLEV